ncbi:MAG: hypothetical protein ABI478_06865, partial [Propionivibrio sp.]
TQDYVPGAVPDEESYDTHVNDRMDSYVAWIRETDFSDFRKLSKKGDVGSIEGIKKQIQQNRDDQRSRRLASLVTAIEKPLGLDAAQKKQLTNILNQHPIVQRALG